MPRVFGRGNRSRPAALVSDRDDAALFPAPVSGAARKWRAPESRAGRAPTLLRCLAPAPRSAARWPHASTNSVYISGIQHIDRALEINPSDVDSYQTRGNILVWAGRAAEGLPWLEGALRLDRGHIQTAQSLCWAYYFLSRYSEAVEAGDRALARGLGRSGQVLVHPFLAAAYAEMGRNQDAEGEQVIVMRL